MTLTTINRCLYWNYLFFFDVYVRIGNVNFQGNQLHMRSSYIYSYVLSIVLYFFIGLEWYCACHCTFFSYCADFRPNNDLWRIFNHKVSFFRIGNICDKKCFCALSWTILTITKCNKVRSCFAPSFWKFTNTSDFLYVFSDHEFNNFGYPRSVVIL